MPLVHIHTLRTAKRSPQDLRLLADTIQSVLLSHFNAPSRDRYQIITQHDEGELICEDTNLPDLPRSEKLVMIQIFQQGRDAKTKQATYAELMKQLGEKCGLGPGDLIISVSRNEKEDWSFGAGRAQFLTGEL